MRFASGEGRNWRREREVLPFLSSSTPAEGVLRARLEKSVALGVSHASSEPVKERKRPALGEGKRETELTETPFRNKFTTPREEERR